MHLLTHYNFPASTTNKNYTIFTIKICTNKGTISKMIFEIVLHFIKIASIFFLINNWHCEPISDIAKRLHMSKGTIKSTLFALCHIWRIWMSTL